jgi:hypothetical protein
MSEGHFKHKVGDGLHLVNEQGESSLGCILMNVEVSFWNLYSEEDILNLWNRVYPDRPYSEEVMAKIVIENVLWSEPFTDSPEDLGLTLQDLVAAGLPELAVEVDLIYKSRGVFL